MSMDMAMEDMARVTVMVTDMAMEDMAMECTLISTMPFVRNM